MTITMTTRSYKFNELPTFPRTLFHLKSYDGWKTLTALCLLFTSIYLIMGLGEYALDHNKWVHDLILGDYQVQELPTKHGWRKALFWTKPISAVAKEVLSAADILLRSLIFLCSYCLTWAAFDSKNIEGYIMGLFNMILGMVYILSPLDFIPDMAPIVGSLDDALFSSGMFVLGGYMFSRNHVREQKTKTILDMVNHDDQSNSRNLEKALQLMLEDRGVSIEFLEN